jgi:hypothetical protein
MHPRLTIPEVSMRSKYIVLAMALSVGAVSIAWSADEPTSPAATPAAQPAPAAQPGPAAQLAPAAQQAPAASSTSTEAAAKPVAKDTATPASGKDSEADAQEKHFLGRGYKKEMRNGVSVFCRKEIKLGSRFETKQCGTAQELELAEQQGRDLMNNSRNANGSRVN